MKHSKKVFLVVGARPNLIKLLPVYKAMMRQKFFIPRIVHTGQHYSYRVSGVFLKEFRLPRPHYNFGVGSGSHARQTARIMQKMEALLIKERPGMVVVFGDVNSTLATALAVAKINKKTRPRLVHVEAGLRSGDMRMPEEINRIATDHLSDTLLTTCPEALEHLRREGIARNKIFFVGNVMVDTLFTFAAHARTLGVAGTFGLKKNAFALLTLHRPENVDNKKRFAALLEALGIIADELPVLFPMHPRTVSQIKKLRLTAHFTKLSPSFRRGIATVPALGYFEFLSLMCDARCVFTDSGGIQEETTALGIPCLTLRENTERPITVTKGTNIVAGVRKNEVLTRSRRVIRGVMRKRAPIPFWDGKASVRIVSLLKKIYHER